MVLCFTIELNLVYESPSEHVPRSTIFSSYEQELDEAEQLLLVDFLARLSVECIDELMVSLARVSLDEFRIVISKLNFFLSSSLDNDFSSLPVKYKWHYNRATIISLESIDVNNARTFGSL